MLLQRGPPEKHRSLSQRRLRVLNANLRKVASRRRIRKRKFITKGPRRHEQRLDIRVLLQYLVRREVRAMFQRP